LEISVRDAVTVLLGLIGLVFASACVAGFFGPMLNKHAPVRGGATIVILHGGSHD